MTKLSNFFSYIIKNIVPLIFFKNLFIIFIISAILLLDSGVLNLNTFYIQSIGSGVVIFSGSLFSLSSSSKQKVHSSSQKIKSKNKKHYLFWDSHLLTLNNIHLLNKDLIKKGVNDFFNNKIGNKFDENKHILILFRVQEESGVWSTLGPMHKINKFMENYYIDLISHILDIKSDEYKEMKIVKVGIGYGIRDGIIETPKEFIKVHEKQNYKHYKLPITLDPLKYGSLIYFDKPNNTYILHLGQLTQAIVKSLANENHVELMRDGKLILSYKDIILEANKFKRIIGNNKYIYSKEGEGYNLLEFSSTKSGKNITKLKPEKPLKQIKIATMDLETFKNIDGKLIPYLLCWYDGTETHSYFLSDYNSPEDMLTQSIKDLFYKKYNSFKIYIHNFSNFDCIFLLDTLTKLGSCQPILNKGKFISVSLTFPTKKDNKKFYKLDFRDSIQLLLMSLRKLAISFGVDTQKGIFPHRFVTSDNLNYVGHVPHFSYFDGITQFEYHEYCKNFNNNWSLRAEAIKYCKIDCISLHQILIKFNQLIFDNFKINIIKYPTLPSLSFAIYRTLFIKSFICQLSGKIAKNIKLSYTGGSTDMFIPSNKSNHPIYCYDVNSLYPSVMNNFPMPVGKPTYFEGDIRKNNPDAFGFFYCKITTPTNIKHPILQTHVKTKSGLRTIAALGTYNDMIFSAEMDNAIKLGYKFKILWGYTFEKGFIFTDFISSLYTMRLNYPKSNPMNYIAKIIMNSLYGRFGMDDQFTVTQIVHKDDYDKFEKINIDFIKDVIPLNENYMVETRADHTKTELDPQNETHNINIAIASAVTSYARIVMSQFKNNSNLTLYYTDTDSVYTNLSPSEMNTLFPGIVNNKELGKLKLENVCSKGIFISPKCYYLLTEDNQEIIKVKGLNKEGVSKLSQSDFDMLLNKDYKIEANQAKWFKSIEESTILIKDSLYTIQQTSNKRELIFNSDNIAIDTKPYTINENKEIINKDN